jgi:amidase
MPDPSMMHEVLSLSGLAQGRLIADGTITSEELIRVQTARIEAVNPALNAAIEVLAESALAAARQADGRRSQGRRRGPLDGVPFSIKDSIEVQGTVASAGTLGYRHAPPSAADATLVARLRAAGAIPLARTNAPDLLFAFESDNLIHGRTNNPYDHSRTSGGSSGGEAALIAACGSPFGLGSDAAGSVRVPAHFCGIASLKPTSGRLPRTGHVPPASGWVEAVWQIGPNARHVEDLCAMMPLLLGADGRDHTVVPMPYSDPAQVPVDGLRIAWFADNGIMAPDAETQAVVRDAASALHACAARPPGIERVYELEMRYLAPDGGEGMREFLRGIGSTRVHPLLDGWLRHHEEFRTSLAGFAACWDEVHEFRAGMHAFLRDFDAILSPAAAFPALPHGDSIRDDRFPGFSYTMTHNLTGWPAAVVRCGQTREGLPIGVQIATAPWREDIALALALRLEQEFGGWQPAPRHP